MRTVRIESLLCVTFVFSVTLWRVFSQIIHHKVKENDGLKQNSYARFAFLPGAFFPASFFPVAGCGLVVPPAGSLEL